MGGERGRAERDRAVRACGPPAEEVQKHILFSQRRVGQGVRAVGEEVSVLGPHHTNLSASIVDHYYVPIGVNREPELANWAHAKHSVPVLARWYPPREGGIGRCWWR